MLFIDGERQDRKANDQNDHSQRGDKWASITNLNGKFRQFRL